VASIAFAVLNQGHREVIVTGSGIQPAEAVTNFFRPRLRVGHYWFGNECDWQPVRMFTIATT